MCIFGKKIIGLDIADGSIELVKLKKIFGKSNVLKTARVVLESGIVENGRIIDSEKLSVAIKNLFTMAKLKVSGKKIVFGLPESQVYLRNFVISLEKGQDRNELIKKEINTNIPILDKDLVFSVRILKQDKEKMEVLVAASNRDLIKCWLDFFKQVNLKVEILDIEVLATFRGLGLNNLKEPVCVVDMGARTCFVAVFDELGLRYEYVINKAGEYLTQAIVETAGLTLEKAEAEKNMNGLKSKSKKVVGVLEKELNVIAKEIKEGIEFCKNEKNISVAKIVLVGGTSQLNGLKEYLAEKLEVSVEVGGTKFLKEKSSLFFIEAVGLALRGVNSNWNKKDPDLTLNY